MLFLARTFIYLGGLSALVVLGMLISSLSSPYFQMNAVGVAFMLPVSLTLFVLSGLFAAIVAFEENYRLSVSKK